MSTASASALVATRAGHRPCTRPSAPARRSLAPRPVAALDQRVPSRGAGCDHAGRGRSRLRCARAWPPSRASTGSTRPSSAAARPAWPAGRRTPHGSSVGSAWQRILRRCRGCARHRWPLRGSSGCGWVTGRLPGGFRVWWRRLHNNSEEDLDDTHLMRMAGRFSRRVRGFAKAHGIPVIDCGRGERKHRIAEEYLATHTVGVGVFLILVARAAATVWEVKRSTQGVIGNIAKKTAYVNHYSFHIMDPDWGHLTVKMSGHPPFGAQVILNGHEWVACQAQTAGIGYTKEGNCFTAVADPQALAQVADTLSQPATAGRLSQVCERWIYSACLCFGLDADEQARSGFRYAYSVYQVEYSRN